MDRSFLDGSLLYGSLLYGLLFDRSLLDCLLLYGSLLYGSLLDASLFYKSLFYKSLLYGSLFYFFYCLLSPVFFLLSTVIIYHPSSIIHYFIDCPSLEQGWMSQTSLISNFDDNDTQIEIFWESTHTEASLQGWSNKIHLPKIYLKNLQHTSYPKKTCCLKIVCPLFVFSYISVCVCLPQWTLITFYMAHSGKSIAKFLPTTIGAHKLSVRHFTEAVLQFFHMSPAQTVV